MEEVHRALHVDLLRGLRDEFGLRRKNCGQVEDSGNLGLAFERIEQTAVEDVPDEGCGAAARQRGREGPEIEGHDVKDPELGQVADEAMADLTASSRDERDLTG